MPLQKIQFKPGFNKQQTATGAEGQWIDGDNIRFRYGLPEPTSENVDITNLVSVMFSMIRSRIRTI